MVTKSTSNGMWAKVSADGKSAAAGMSLGPVDTKPGGGGEEQPYDDHGRYLGTLYTANTRGKTATAERVRAMGRDPTAFYIHAGKINGERTASQGCIIIAGKSERMAIRQLQGAKIRVVRSPIIAVGVCTAHQPRLGMVRAARTRLEGGDVGFFREILRL